MGEVRTKTRPFAALFAADQDRVRADLATFFGPGAATYLETYEKMRGAAGAGRHYVRTWSWPAFLGGFVWFFYRKMYGIGAMFFLLPLVLIYLMGRSGIGGLWAVSGTLGKSTYVQSALHRIAKADELGLAGAERTHYLRQAGGVSFVGGGLAAFVYVGLLATVIVAFATAKRHVR